MTPNQKGTIAETAVIHAAAKLDVPVLKPVNDGLRYDLAFDLGHRILRVQCKWAARRGDCISVNARTCRRGPDGFIRSTYSSDDVDVVAAYCAEVDSCYAIPIDRLAGRPSITLRLSPTRNNQQKGVNWARDFAFAATLRQLVGP
jgi:hypothetical protein